MTELVENPVPSGLGVVPGGECPCGRRAEAIGTCRSTEGRVMFRAFHHGPPMYHWLNAANWACVDCVADAAVAVASGKVREDMHVWAQAHRAAITEGVDR